MAIVGIFSQPEGSKYGMQTGAWDMKYAQFVTGKCPMSLFLSSTWFLRFSTRCHDTVPFFLVLLKVVFVFV